MNDKQEFIYRILDIVIECCDVSVDGEPPMSREDILGQDRHENVLMTRCMFSTQMKFAGYSNTTISKVLKRTEKSVQNILNQAKMYRNQSFAYRYAEAKVTIKLKELMNDIEL